MTVALGLLAGIGVALAVSPALWPRSPRSKTRRARPGRIRGLLASAGWARVPPGAFVGVCAMAGLIAAAAAHTVLGITALSAAATAMGSVLPVLVVTARRRARRRAHRAAWPDAIDRVIAGVRSGLALPEALAALADGADEVFRDTFSGFARDYRNTGRFAPAAGRLKEALADPIADRVVATLIMAREVGGTELVPVLKSLSASLREEGAARAEAEARQSWTTAAARLGVAAPWVVLVLLSTRPEAAAAYNSSGGAAVILFGLVVSVLAYRLMLVLGRLPEERRWFQ